MADFSKLEIFPELVVVKPFDIEFDEVKEILMRNVSWNDSVDGTFNFQRGGNKFHISQRMKFSKTISFSQALVTEITGEIQENQILFKIGVSRLYRIFFAICILFLGFLSIGFFDSREYETGVILLSSILVAYLLLFFISKSEFGIMEDLINDIW